jgi:hypothetical protein
MQFRKQQQQQQQQQQSKISMKKVRVFLSLNEKNRSASKIGE